MRLFGRGEKKAMSERQQILQMLASGKITVAEAEKLLTAVEGASTGTAVEPVAAPPAKRKARYLRVCVSGGGSEKVDVRVPLQLIRAGVKLGSFIPENVQLKIDEELQDKGIQFKLKDIKAEDVEELIDGLSEFEVNVNDNGEGVRVFCE